jgi:hypothetical protein
MQISARTSSLNFLPALRSAEAPTRDAGLKDPNEGSIIVAGAYQRVESRTGTRHAMRAAANRWVDVEAIFLLLVCMQLSAE